jgi:hypothetical protein
VIELFQSQANKLLRACDGHFEKVMKLLDFQGGKMYVKHFDILMCYERFMPEKANQEKQRKSALREKASNITLSLNVQSNMNVDSQSLNPDEARVSYANQPAAVTSTRWKFNKKYLDANQRVPKFSLCSGNKEFKLNSVLQKKDEEEKKMQQQEGEGSPKLKKGQSFSFPLPFTPEADRENT